MNTMKQKAYESPEMEVMEMNPGQVICQSGGIKSMNIDAKQELDW